ncbi:MAG: Rieske 2Fe-2S domain-containing protein [Firmicutes bacterium]|nr:Rieske 2Fe-2S domain-containing protein [Alicyclobacillaceae bacterium]MCL6497743.1 Rieske 2Fe-2S domain-containing protein [Bacillota bacterium]
MLTAADNRLLTRTGPKTPMGQLLRRYWIPILLSEELAEPGGPPVRVPLLGESLVAFRSPDGTVGLVEEACPHRRASLYYGRNEPGGIRCLYHGWKYDLEGRCVEMPTEPPKSAFREKIRLAAYPCREEAGVIWAYLGPREEMPPLPRFEWMTVADSQRFVSRRLRECNYFQILEGGMDSSHVGILHADTRYWNRVFKASEEEVRILSVVDASPEYFVEPAPWGLVMAARRETPDPGRLYWRLTPWILPWYIIVPPFLVDAPYRMDAVIPLDDQHSWLWAFSWHPERPLTAYERYLYSHGIEGHLPAQPGTVRTLPNADNEYLIDRDLIRFGAFSGIKAVQVQDMAMQDSQGRILDRTREHLGTSDIAIIEARRTLIGLARQRPPADQLPGRTPESHRVRSVTRIVDEATDLRTLIAAMVIP